MRLRLATHEDIPEMARIGAEMHSSSSFAPMDYDPQVVGMTLGYLINNAQFCFVAEDDEGIIGGMMGMVVPSWFGHDMVANDLALFIRQHKRGGMAAVRLVEAFVSWAKAAGARQIRPGVNTGDARAEMLYERLGFNRVGASFCMDVEAQDEIEKAA